MQGAQAQFGRGVFSALRVRGLDGGQAARLRGVSPPLTAEFSWLPQHFLNFEPEPQGQGPFRGVFEPITWSRLRICGLGWVVLQNEPADQVSGVCESVWLGIRPGESIFGVDGAAVSSALQNELASGFAAVAGADSGGTAATPPSIQGSL